VTLAQQLRKEASAVIQDKTLTCRDCGESFVFTAGEQQFYAERGFQNEPSRCVACRNARRAAGPRPGNTGGGGGGGGFRGERRMYPATCSACGKETEVPFQPRGDRPVYCSDCFDRQRR
jgi:CxxC-x17-CxxC domain-containing protein